jgi:hypothetical protein
MNVQSLEVYAEDSNYAIIKPPGRAFPGAVIQGDSLCGLCRLAIDVARRVQAAGIEDEELLGDLDELLDRLLGRLSHYQTVLEHHGIRLPYHPPLRESDWIRLLPDDLEDGTETT